MLPSSLMFARTSATLLAVAACSAAPSPAARDSVPASASTAASAPGPAPGAASSGAVVATTPSRPDSSSAAPAQVPSSFTRILTQHNSGFDEPAELVIRDRAALEAAWARVFNQVQGNPPPAVDFAKETVILVALGTRSTGGHSVHVDAVTRTVGGAVVRYTATRPGDGCMSTQSLTSPVDVVRMPHIEGTVRFERREVVQPC
jgi:hypothetical protein